LQLDANVSVSETQTGASVNGATVSFSNALASDVLDFENGQASHTFGDGDIITASFTDSGGTATLTLTGVASTTDWGNALASVEYHNTGDATNAGADTARNVNWTVQDDISNTATGKSKIVTATSPAAPPSVNASGLVTFTENGPTQLLDSTLTISDPSSLTIKAAEVVLSNATSADSLAVNGGQITIPFGTGDTLTVTATGFNAAADTYTLEITGAGTAAEYQQVLREVDYGSLSGDDPTAVGSHTQRGVTWFLSTDGTTFPNATGNTSTLDVLHSAKIAAGNTQNYLEGGGPVVIEPFVTFGDTDTITQVQLALPGTEALSTDTIGFLNGAGSLAVDITLTKGQTFGGIAGDGSEFQISRSGGTLTITSITVAGVTVSNIDFEAAAREVAYLNNTDPTSAPNQSAQFGPDTSRDFIWSITDNNAVTTNNTFASGQPRSRRPGGSRRRLRAMTAPWRSNPSTPMRSTIGEACLSRSNDMSKRWRATTARWRSTPNMPGRGTTGRSFWVSSIGRTKRWRASIAPWRSSPIK
jgi:hypothetical protein